MDVPRRWRGSLAAPSSLIAALAAACLLFAGPGATPPLAEAAGSGAAAPARRADPLKTGKQLFDQCVSWVAMGGRGITHTTDFYIHIIAELDLDNMTHRGPMRLWWQRPARYRQELTIGRQVTSKILDGDRLWIRSPNGRVSRMHGTAEGVKAIRQLKEDRDRLGDLAQFITLQSLAGGGATFRYLGATRGTGTYAGNWLKLRRDAPNSAPMLFWIAYQRNAQGRVTATWPGIVRVEGDPRRGIPTEDYLLKGWVNPGRGGQQQFRYPRQIDAYSVLPGRQPVRFLRANVQDMKINAGIDPSRFRP